VLLKNKNIISLAETESTNNYAMQLVLDKYHEGTVVLAQYQGRGRGQAGSYWESEAGKNLLMSLILEPKFLEAGKQFYLSMAVSLALVNFLKKNVEGVKIKWPNDIYVDDKKIAGILIEQSVKGLFIESSVVGIGLNVNQVRFVSDAPNPVSMKQLTGKEFEIEVILDGLLKEIELWYDLLMQNAFSKIEIAYLENLFRMNAWHNYRTRDEEFTARIVGIGEFGQLQLELQSGETRSYLFKEVEFVL